MKGFFTQGFVILLKEHTDLSQIHSQLTEYNVIKEVPKAKSWELGGPALVVEYLKDVNGYISIDIVNNPWPDHMGEPKAEPMLFAAWSMGHFGPFTYPYSLKRAIRQSWSWGKAKEYVTSHKGFIRLRLSYVFGSNKNATVLPKKYDPLKELDFLTSIASSLLHFPFALCYFNPNGEILLTKELLDNSLLYYKENNIPALDIWSNIRIYNLTDKWILMDSVGSWQLDIPDQEVAYPKGKFSPQDVSRFIRNAVLYLIQNGPVIKDGDTMDGPGGIRWQAKSFKNGLCDPPRATLRWVPTDAVDIPDTLLFPEIS